MRTRKRRRWALHFALDGKGQDTLIFVMCFLAIIPLVSPRRVFFFFLLFFFLFHGIVTLSVTRSVALFVSPSSGQGGLARFSRLSFAVPSRLVKARWINSWLIRLVLPVILLLSRVFLLFTDFHLFCHPIFVPHRWFFFSPDLTGLLDRRITSCEPGNAV
jgi:hypothetical protein